jgi:hypothetical protein
MGRHCRTFNTLILNNMKELSFERMEETSGGKFIGTESVTLSDCVDGQQLVLHENYFFWIRISSDVMWMPC